MQTMDLLCDCVFMADVCLQFCFSFRGSNEKYGAVAELCLMLCSSQKHASARCRGCVFLVNSCNGRSVDCCGVI